MTIRYTFFGTPCMRLENVESDPGELVIVMRKCLSLRGPDSDQAIDLRPGDILYSDGLVGDLKETLDRHLIGTAVTSELRFGTAFILGLDPTGTAGVGCAGEDAIDAWLNEHVVFAIRKGADLSETAAPGLLNGTVIAVSQVRGEPSSIQ